MANVISSLLVGIGFDYDKKSADQVNSGIDGVKSKALQLGGLVAGAFGAKALTFGFAASADELGKFSEVYGVMADDVKALGNVFGLAGGNLQGFMQQLSGIERMRAGLLTGDAAFIASVERAGIDTQSLIESENAMEAFLSLANQFESLSQQQRLNAAEALGLDDAAIRVLSQGRTEIEGQIAAQKEMLSITEDMTKEAAEFNDAWQNLGTSLGGISSRISSLILPSITDMVESLQEGVQAINAPLQDESAFKQIREGFADPHFFDKMLFGREIKTFDDFASLFGGDDESQQLLTAQGMTAAPELVPTTSGMIIRDPVGTGMDQQQGRSQPIQVNSTINATIEMDGQAVAKKVIQVTEQQDGEAIQNLTSSTNR